MKVSMAMVRFSMALARFPKRRSVCFPLDAVKLALAAGALAAGALAASPVSAQIHPPENVTLLSHLDRGNEYSGNWGYTSPASGIELAISGVDTGTTFINATIPENAAEVAFIPGPQSIWREMATYGNFCYIVTEATGAALQIVSLVNPLSPVLVATLNPPALPYATAHEIKIDQETGFCYVAGTRNGGAYSGLIILDLNSNPLAPTLRGVWPESGFSTQNYVHDLSIQDSKAYCAAIYPGIVYVLDVSQAGTPPVLGSWTYPTAFTHNTWPTADGSYLVTTDENNPNPAGHLRMWDMRDLGQVQQTDEWISPTAAIVHNAYIRGDYCFMSHYQDGLRVVNVSNPSNIYAVGWYDTHPLDGAGYRGAWGCYCFAADSTIVYISDRDTGTYIFRFEPPALGIENRPEGASAARAARPVLLGGFPNPFHPATAIRFQLPHPNDVKLRIMDVSGQVVRVLAAGPLAAGLGEVVWDGRDEASRPVAGGVYFIELSTPGAATISTSTGSIVRIQ